MNDASGRQLLLVRHAKSSWRFSGLNDDERPLNPRGWRDAPVMAAWLVARETAPQVMLTSYATRALTTARVFARAWGYPIEAIQLSEQLYEAELGELLAVIRSLDAACRRVAIVGHNPGFNALLANLTGLAVDNIPTCGVANIRIPEAHWQQVDAGCGELVWLQTPKQLAGLCDLACKEDSA